VTPADSAVASQVEDACKEKRWKHVIALLTESPAGARGHESTHWGEALHWAAWHGHEPTVRWLLARGADLEALDAAGQQAVHLAAANGQLSIVHTLWEYDSTVICRGDTEAKTPAHFAAQKGLVHVMEWLYIHGAPITSQDLFGFTPLHWACFEGRTLVVQLLLRCGVDTLVGDIRGRSSLHWIGLQGRGLLLDSILRFNPKAFGGEAQWQLRDRGGKTPRQLASWCGSPCLRTYFARLEAWLHDYGKETDNGLEGDGEKTQDSRCTRAPPRHLLTFLPPVALVLLHVANVAAPCYGMAMHLWTASSLTSEHVLLVMLQVACQLLSVRHWAAACLADPGYCQATLRLDVGEPGPDKRERAVADVQAELNALLRQYREVLQEINDHVDKDSEEGAASASAARVSRRRELEASMETGKLRLGERLQEAGAARLEAYPRDYVRFVCDEEVAKNTKTWGQRACVVCGRLRKGRSKHCKDCGRCVARFDHHCPWLGNCVGAANVVAFVAFLGWLFLALVTSQIVNWKLLEASPLVAEDDWSPLWRFIIKANSVGNGLWLLFVSSLYCAQICLASCDRTAYEAGQKDPCSDFKLRQLLNWRVLALGAVRNVFRILLSTTGPTWPRTSSTSFDDDFAAGVDDCSMVATDGVFPEDVEAGRCKSPDGA